MRNGKDEVIRFRYDEDFGKGDLEKTYHRSKIYMNAVVAARECGGDINCKVILPHYAQFTQVCISGKNSLEEAIATFVSIAGSPSENTSKSTTKRINKALKHFQEKLK